MADSTATSPGNIQAMVVGASDVVARRIKSVLGDLKGVDLAAEAKDGVDAVSRLRRRAIDVIFIDIGDTNAKLATDLSRLLKVDAHAQIVLVATLTFANVKNAMAGLVAGAAEFVQAPSRHTPHIAEAEFTRQIADLALALGRARRDKGQRVIAPPPAARFEHPTPKDLRKRRLHVPKAIAIASSTGGPQALLSLFNDLPREVVQPIFLTQHMPAGFTAALSDHIKRRTGWHCSEGKDGEAVKGGQIYMAPGDYHMTVRRAASGPVVATDQGPEESYCRPSAEPMMRGLIDVYGADNVLFVVLTGMGSDGKAGAKAVADGGGTVVVQDKETSVVWGMPGAVAAAGDCHAILPLSDIPGFIAQAARGK
ncbi:MAG: chemotaxis response regulator protein-glutamate methylesterase [Rhodospirillales bacterium CG15_BIG_FIL_POST_REV_8_21_14_020_66_15]|nr:MAG: chemotaxis response regulator protein-glutamate methylesterase [Rhodospirillales bacterium CG15_BIG_FIL_POST_REV_8_21_14_020_66_15]